MPPKPLKQPEAVGRGLALWLAVVAIVVVGIVLAFRNARAVTSLLGTHG